MDTETYNNELSPELDNIIEKVLRGAADAHETSLLEEWVAADSENRRIFEQKRALFEVLEPAFNPASVNVELALKRIHRKMRHSFDLRLFALRFAAAMVLPLCVAIGWLLLRTPAEAETPMLSISAPFGGLLQTKLPDGSHVWLNSNSTLEYPVMFDGDQRLVALTGEAYFEVNADKRHPFIVRTGDIDVTATGTAFNVNAYTGSPVDVTLVDGHVGVNVGDRRHFELSPGERLCINENTAEITHSTGLEKWCSWKDGKLMFDNDRLDAVLARISQIYPVDFVIEDSALANKRLHATLCGESIHDILHLLEIGVPMSCVPAQKTDSAQRTVVYVSAPPAQ